MISRILDLPVFLIFVILACLAMYIPAIHALTQDAFHVARSFFYSATLGLILCALIGIAF
jgi:trk system potassium uptake protein TrkH